MNYVLTAIIAYLLGSISFAVIISKHFFHDDVRSHGSGNAGMTNSLRTYGPAAGLVVPGGDFLKGALAVYIGLQLTHSAVGACLAGALVMAGHMFPLYFGFRGGKGVATGAGVVLMLCPLVFLGALLIFSCVLGFTRYMSLASICGAASFPILSLIYRLYTHAPAVDLIVYSVFAFLAGGTVIWMHRSNIRRLLDGNERKFSFKKSA